MMSTPRPGSRWIHVEGEIVEVLDDCMIKAFVGSVDLQRGGWIEGVRYQRVGDTSAKPQRFVRSVEDFRARFTPVGAAG